LSVAAQDHLEPLRRSSIMLRPIAVPFGTTSPFILTAR